MIRQRGGDATHARILSDLLLELLSDWTDWQAPGLGSEVPKEKKAKDEKYGSMIR